MNKPIIMFVAGLAVVVGALLATLRIMGNITDSQLWSVGLKVGLILVVLLASALLVAWLAKPRGK